MKQQQKTTLFAVLLALFWTSRLAGIVAYAVCKYGRTEWEAAWEGHIILKLGQFGSWQYFD